MVSAGRLLKLPLGAVVILQTQTPAGEVVVKMVASRIQSGLNGRSSRFPSERLELALLCCGEMIARYSSRPIRLN
ncbi:hypothetical protein HNY73_018454 [Argiope bruennichi]|uniref:Uncharacterized protein n=1 Tax=Argiope bruennichi TaxID=94029 RepID=A0A8T0EEB1_ARGBR|nr:hypothetical protein HNY73_018454 [Argiope bruennichi]